MKRFLVAVSLVVLLALIGLGLNSARSMLRGYQQYQKTDAAFEHWMNAEKFARAGQHQAAITESHKAIQLDPSLTSVRYLLARIYRKQKQAAKAMTEYRAIIEQKSGESDKTGAAWAHYDLGELLYSQGQKEEAREQWRAAIACAPGDVMQQRGIYEVRKMAERALVGKAHSTGASTGRP
jgi:Tfp pilus assembly protein PilF